MTVFWNRINNISLVVCLRKHQTVNFVHTRFLWCHSLSRCLVGVYILSGWIYLVCITSPTRSGNRFLQDNYCISPASMSGIEYMYFGFPLFAHFYAIAVW